LEALKIRKERDSTVALLKFTLFMVSPQKFYRVEFSAVPNQQGWEITEARLFKSVTLDLDNKIASVVF